MRRANDAILVSVRVIDRDLGGRSLGVDHQLRRSHQQFGFRFQFDRHDQVLRPETSGISRVRLPLCLRSLELAFFVNLGTFDSVVERRDIFLNPVDNDSISFTLEPFASIIA